MMCTLKKTTTTKTMIKDFQLLTLLLFSLGQVIKAPYPFGSLPVHFFNESS